MIAARSRGSCCSPLTDGLGEEPGWRRFLLPLQLEHVSIVCTWVFEHTNGSALSAIPLHAASNLCTRSASVAGGASWQRYLRARQQMAARRDVVLAGVRQRGRGDPLVAGFDVTHWWNPMRVQIMYSIQAWT